MKDQDKTKEQLINELVEMRQRIAELEIADTKHKQAEEAQRESEELLRATLESTADGILVIGENGKMIHANIRFAEMWRIPQPVLDSRDDDTLLAFVLDQLQDPETFLTKVRYLYGSSEEDLDTLQFKDGRVFERFSRPLLQDDMVAGRVWSFRDITERTRAEDALQRKTRQQEQLLETTRHLTASLNVEEVLTRIGMGAKEILEAYGCAIYLLEPDGRTLTPVVAIEPPHEEAILSTPINVETSFTGQAIKTRQALIFNDISGSDYGQQIPSTPVEEEERVIVAPFVVDDDKVLGAMCLSRLGRFFSEEDLALVETFATYAVTALRNAQTHDELQHEVTERVRAEEELLRLYEQAQQDAEAKAFLLDEVNHRVKNTLVAIIGLLHVEQEYAEMADQATYEAVIQNLSNRVSGLATVHDLLSASEWEPLPLSDLAGQVIKSAMQMRPRDKQVFIDVPPSPVRVTPDQAHNLAIVINELATNTIQHTLPGRSTARISVRISLEDDNIVLEVRDDGPGYPEDVLQLERHAVGFDLIQNLARQSLHGELSLHNDEGAVAAIRFPAQA